MMDYIVNVYENEKFEYAIGGCWMYYDDVLWWQLTELIKALNDEDKSYEEVLKKINTVESSYWALESDKRPSDDADGKIDLTNRTITMPDMPIYEMDEEIPCIKLVKKDDKYFAEYEGIEQVEMPFVYFDRTDLFEKKVVTFEEFLIVANFFNDLMYENEKTKGNTDFILNDNKVIRFNPICL